VSRLEKITAFLGLLEMLKMGSVQVVQEELFGPIWIEWKGLERLESGELPDSDETADSAPALEE